MVSHFSQELIASEFMSKKKGPG